MRIMLFLLAVTVALTLIATSAYAGTYDVWSCSGPSGEPLPERGWTPRDRGGTTSSSCGSRGGSFSAHLSPHAVSSQGYARWTFDAPANTTIADVTINRFAAASSSGYMGPWHRSYYLFRDAPIVMEGYVTDFCVAILSVCDRRGDPMAPFSAQSQYSTPIQAQRIIASVQCDGTAPCEPREGEAAGLVQVYRARVGIADGLPPAFSAAPSGSLLEPSGPVHGERMARFDGKDLGGGLFSAELVVDGNKVAESRVTAEGCREPFDAPVPCPGEAAGTIGFDTAALENGPHRVQVALLDAARNRTLSDPVLVSVQNDKGPNGQGASRVARLRARFRSAKTDVQRERVVGFGKTAVVVGRLVDQRGAAIRGAELRAHTRLDRLGGRERRVATVRTDDHGRYRWRVPKGPSRLVRIGYRAYHSDPGESASAEVRLGVRPAIALSVHPTRVENRGRISFEGRLIGGPGKAGAQITIEAVGRRSRQRVPVTTLRANRRGRFRFGYRFLRSFAPFTYRFRARLMRQASYPYASGSSRIVTVHIVR